MTPVYLAEPGCRVRLDGPALRIELAQQADRWMPLRRVASVTSTLHVDWDVEALLACARAGVFVSFVDADGGVVARVIGRAAQRGHLAERWAAFRERSDCAELLDAWERSMQRMAVRSVLKRAGLGADAALDGRALRRWFQESAEGMGAEAAFRAIGGAAYGSLSTLVTQRLLEAGVDVARDAELDISLPECLTGILFWDFQLPRAAWLEHRLLHGEVEPPSRRAMVAWFEWRRRRVERLLEGLLRRLHRWLVDCV